MDPCGSRFMQVICSNLQNFIFMFQTRPQSFQSYKNISFSSVEMCINVHKTHLNMKYPFDQMLVFQSCLGFLCQNKICYWWYCKTWGISTQWLQVSGVCSEVINWLTKWMQLFFPLSFLAFLPYHPSSPTVLKWPRIGGKRKSRTVEDGNMIEI